MLDRFSKSVPFPWKPDMWYTMKFQANVVDGKAVLKGKVWPRGETEPAAWTIEAEDDAPNLEGSPGLFGNASNAELFYDNILVTPAPQNERARSFVPYVSRRPSGLPVPKTERGRSDRSGGGPLPRGLLPKRRETDILIVKFQRDITTMTSTRISAILVFVAAVFAAGCGAAKPAAKAAAKTAAGKKEPPKAAGPETSNRWWNQWAGSSIRNNTPVGKNIPAEFEPGDFDNKTGEWKKETSKNIKWVAKLGSQSYGNPVVADGKIWVGTNNGAGWLKRYPAETDLGCLLCFNEADGKFLWQHSSEKLPTGRVHDWPLQGICCAPYVEGKRLWFVTSRGEVLCLDTEGFS